MLCHFYRLCVQRVGITTIPCAPTGNDLGTTMNVIVIDEDHTPIHSLLSSKHHLRSQGGPQSSRKRQHGGPLVSATSMSASVATRRSRDTTTRPEILIPKARRWEVSTPQPQCTDNSDPRARCRFVGKRGVSLGNEKAVRVKSHPRSCD